MIVIFLDPARSQRPESAVSTKSWLRDTTYLAEPQSTWDLNLVETDGQIPIKFEAVPAGGEI